MPFLKSRVPPPPTLTFEHSYFITSTSPPLPIQLSFFDPVTHKPRAFPVVTSSQNPLIHPHDTLIELSSSSLAANLSPESCEKELQKPKIKAKFSRKITGKLRGIEFQGLLDYGAGFRNSGAEFRGLRDAVPEGECCEYCGSGNRFVKRGKEKCRCVTSREDYAVDLGSSSLGNAGGNRCEFCGEGMNVNNQRTNQKCRCDTSRQNLGTDSVLWDSRESMEGKHCDDCGGSSVNNQRLGETCRCDLSQRNYKAEFQRLLQGKHCKYCLNLDWYVSVNEYRCNLNTFLRGIKWIKEAFLLPEPELLVKKRIPKPGIPARGSIWVECLCGPQVEDEDCDERARLEFSGKVLGMVDRLAVLVIVERGKPPVPTLSAKQIVELFVYGKRRKTSSVLPPPYAVVDADDEKLLLDAILQGRFSLSYFQALFNFVIYEADATDDFREIISKPDSGHAAIFDKSVLMAPYKDFFQTLFLDLTAKASSQAMDEESEINVRTLKALVFRALDHVQKASAAYDDVFAFAKTIEYENPELFAITLNNYGTAKYQLNQPETNTAASQFKECFFTSARILINTNYASASLANLASIYVDLGLFDKAIESLKLSLELDSNGSSAKLERQHRMQCVEELLKRLAIVTSFKPKVREKRLVHVFSARQIFELFMYIRSRSHVVHADVEEKLLAVLAKGRLSLSHLESLFNMSMNSADATKEFREDIFKADDKFATVYHQSFLLKVSYRELAEAWFLDLIDNKALHQASDEQSKINLMFARAYVFRVLGNIEKARTAYDEVIVFAKTMEATNKEVFAIACNNYGVAKYEMCQPPMRFPPQECKELFLRSAKVLDKSKLAAVPLANLASFYSDIEMFNEAIENFKLALKLDSDDKIFVAENLELLHRKQGNEKIADEYAKLAGTR